MIYHLTTQAAWDEARIEGKYTPDSLASEGFIHASTAAQILPVANAFYQDVEHAVLLIIDETRLSADLRWEAPAPPDGSKPAPDAALFPHIYGALNLDAVIGIQPIEKDAGGFYILPEGAELD